MNASIGAAVIEMKDVTKVFETDEVETYALYSVNLSIARGEFVVICGPSGCGKSTLLSIIGLLDAATSGQFLLNGKDASNLDATARAKLRNLDIGFIFQAFNLINDLTVLENVELSLTYRPGLEPAERRRRTLSALERVAMQHRMNHYPGQLSGGQQQRVAVARALVGEPSILLADEPTGNLDTKNGDVVMELLHDINHEGTTICMVTHDTKHAKAVARQVQLIDGRVASDLSKEHVYKY